MDFVKLNLGKKYRLTVSQIINGDDISEGNQTGFFCSELVASLYQYLGIITKTKPASAYWPCSFGNESNQRTAVFTGEVRLGAEVGVHLDI